METGTLADPSMAPLKVVGTVELKDRSLAPQVEAGTVADKYSQGTAGVIGNIPFQGKLFIGGVERESSDWRINGKYWQSKNVILLPSDLHD